MFREEGGARDVRCVCVVVQEERVGGAIVAIAAAAAAKLVFFLVCNAPGIDFDDIFDLGTKR